MSRTHLCNLWEKKLFVFNWCLFCLNTIKFSKKEGHKYSRPHISSMHNLYFYALIYFFHPHSWLGGIWIELSRDLINPWNHKEGSAAVTTKDRAELKDKGQSTSEMMAWDAALNVLAGDAQTQAMIMTSVRVKGV